MRFEFNDDSQKICNSADIVNYGIQCDICGNKFQSVSNINGKRYCAGCYYKTFMKDNQQAEIDQLKQQLAEKQNTIDEINKEFVQAVHDWKVLCADKDKELLKQKEKSARTEQIYNGIIVDKDKEIEKLKNLFELNNEVVINQGKEIFDLRVQVLQQKQNQIQLAIQELEKFRAKLVNRFSPVELSYTEYAQKLFEELNQQIKELKGEKDE